MQSPPFEALFQRAATVHSSAPGRVNLMGDHTDYNEGFVLPAAIPQRTHVELARRSDRRVRVWSAGFPETGVIEYALGEEARHGDWADFVRGLTALLLPDAPTGFDARITSTVPLGSGLSSSAALEIAVARALREAFDLPQSDIEMARLARRTENEFVGAPVGIMDQMACSLAAERSALFLDTRTLAFRTVALPDHCGLFVIHSGVAHRHVGGGYVVRRRECDEAAAMLEVKTLRDVQDLDPSPTVRRLPEPLARRVRHVITENGRVLDTVAALEAGDVSRAGQLFAESHASLRDDFQVSIEEMDTLVGIASKTRGVYGARMTGGGFGGSIVGISEPSRTGAAAREIADAYSRATGNHGTVVVPAPSLDS